MLILIYSVLCELLVLLLFNKKQFLESNADLEYFEIVDGHTLEPIADEKDTDFVVACIAAYIEGVRLIDNMILKGGF